MDTEIPRYKDSDPPRADMIVDASCNMKNKQCTLTLLDGNHKNNKKIHVQPIVLNFLTSYFGFSYVSFVFSDWK